MLVDVLVGENPTGGNCPVATVVMSGNGTSDQSVESPDVGKCRDAHNLSKVRAVGEGTGCRQTTDFPGSKKTTC